MYGAERLVEAFLRKRFARVVHEPDGNVPPDFLADDAVAVEVRRLNQNEASTGQFRSLEESSIPLHMGMRSLLEKISLANKERAFWVSFSFRRPIPRWKDIRPWVTAQLEALRPGDKEETRTFSLGTFKLEVRAGPETCPGGFLFAGYVDHDAGGWVLAEMKRNIEICVAEKTAKILSVRTRYPTWWLVLVDLIGYGLGESDQQLFRKMIRIEHDWDRLILIDPRDHGRVIEL